MFRFLEYFEAAFHLQKRRDEAGVKYFSTEAWSKLLMTN